MPRSEYPFFISKFRHPNPNEFMLCDPEAEGLGSRRQLSYAVNSLHPAWVQQNYNSLREQG